MHYRTLLISGLSILAIVASGCATTSTRAVAEDAPEWVRGEQLEAYPDDKYVIAVGTGESRREAAQDAKQQLASVFQARVQSLTESSSESTLEENSDNNIGGSATSSASQKVTVLTDVELEGVEIKKYFYSEKAKEHYALAVMDKAAAQKRWQNKLRSLRKEIRGLHRAYNREQTVRRAEEIIQKVEEYNLDNGKFSVVNNGRTAPDALKADIVEDIRSNLSALRSKFAIALEFAAPQPNVEYQEMITTCLADKSISVVAKVEEENPPRYHVIYNIREKKKFMKVKDWVRFEFSSLAVIKKGNLLVARKRDSKVSTGRDKESAFDRVKDDLSESVCKQIAEVVTS